MPLDQFILFGDSITQGCFDQAKGFASGAQLANDYACKLDVINRGNGGYNTEDAVRILNSVLPSPEQARIRILLIFFGTNDAVIPCSSAKQNVPYYKFKENLMSIIKSPLVAAHKNGQTPVRILMVTPPPIEATYIEEWDLAHGIREIHRIADETCQFAQAVRDIASCFSTDPTIVTSPDPLPYDTVYNADVDVGLVDLYSAIMRNAVPDWPEPDFHDLADWYRLPGDRKEPTNQRLREILPDGIHLSGEGYKILYAEVKKTIKQKWPDQQSEVLEPAWKAWELPVAEEGHVGFNYPGDYYPRY